VVTVWENDTRSLPTVLFGQVLEVVSDELPVGNVIQRVLPALPVQSQARPGAVGDLDIWRPHPLWVYPSLKEMP
jgi:hypothetical protein